MSGPRTKTQKRSSSLPDISGENLFTAQLTRNTSTFVNFLTKEADDAYKRPWHRLEKGLRMNRLRLFSENEAKRLDLSAVEKEELLQHLLKAHEKKLLTSKNNVVYDIDTQQIKEIKNLIMHKNADGRMLFQLLEKKNAVTFRKKAGSAAATAATTATETETVLL